MAPQQPSPRIQNLRSKISIEWVWTHLGLPGTPGKNCRSPFRQDKKPSFSIYFGDHQRWFDQTTRQGGDVIDFWKEAKDLASQGEAMRQLEAIVGSAEPPRPVTRYSAATPLVYPEAFTPPDHADCIDLQLLRGISAQAFDLAGKLGTLVLGPDPDRGQLLWWITDRAKKGLEGRTMDGELCRASGKKCIAYPGTSKGWCYGLLTNQPRYDELKNIVMVEGGPDYFAAIELALRSDLNVRVGAMLGAGARFSPETLKLMHGCRVLIIPHRDAEGERAAKAWAEQLASVAKACWTQPLPEEAGDLNDLLKLNPPDVLELLKALR